MIPMSRTNLGPAAAPSSFVDSVSSYMLFAGLGTQSAAGLVTFGVTTPAADSSQPAAPGHNPTDAGSVAVTRVLSTAAQRSAFSVDSAGEKIGVLCHPLELGSRASFCR